IGGKLTKGAAKVGLGGKIFGRSKTVQREVAALGAFQGIVALVADVSETRTANTGGKREDCEFAGRKVFCEVVGLHQAEIDAISNRTRSLPGAGLTPGVSDLLPKVDLPLQALGSECGHIEAVVVESGIDQLEFFVVE